MTTRMLQRRGTAAEWAAANPILADGEIGFERDTRSIKIGDGVTPWSGLSSPFPESLINAKGDLVVGSADNVPVRLARGATGQRLTVQADGSLAWIDPYAGADKVSKAGDVMTGQLFTPLLTAKDAAFSIYSQLNSSSLELGQGRASSGLSLIDFHTTVGTDYDVRLLANGGTGVDGQGLLTLTGGLKVNGAQALSTVELAQDSSAGLAHGPEVVLNDTKAGVSAPKKYIRNNQGTLQVVNNAGTTVILSVDDAGNVTPTGTITLANAKALLLTMSSGSAGSIKGSGTTLQLRGGTSGHRFRNNADTSDTFSVTDSGVLSQIQAVTLSATVADYAQLNLFVHTIDANGFQHNTWMRRTRAGTGWDKVDLVDGIQVDASFATPATARTFWRRDPGVPEMAFGDQGTDWLKLTGSGTFIAVTKTHNFGMTSGADGYIGGATTTLKLRGGSSGFMFRNNADTASIATLDDTGALAIALTTATSKGLVIKGAASQTGSLQEWQDSAGAVLGAISAAGLQSWGPNGSNGTFVSAATGRMGVISRDSTVVVLTVKGAVSQSGDLSQWILSTGTVVAKINSPWGDFSTIGRIAAGGFNNFDGITALSVAPLASGEKGLTVKGLASQTGDLIQVEDSTGAVLAYVDSAGRAGLSGLAIGTTQQATIKAMILTSLAVGFQSQANAVTTVPIVSKGIVSQTGDLFQAQDSTGAVKAFISASGGLGISPATQTTAPTGGAAGVLPTNPVGYFSVTINGTVRKVPYYS